MSSLVTAAHEGCSSRPYAPPYVQAHRHLPGLLLVLGSQRRRLIPALSLDTPSPVRKPTSSTGVRWVDGPLRSTQRGLGEPFEIKVYEIDDVERLQRRRGGTSKVRPLPAQGSQFPTGPVLKKRTPGGPSQALYGQWVVTGGCGPSHRL